MCIECGRLAATTKIHLGCICPASTAPDTLHNLMVETKMANRERNVQVLLLAVDLASRMVNDIQHVDLQARATS